MAVEDVDDLWLVEDGLLLFDSQHPSMRRFLAVESQIGRVPDEGGDRQLVWAKLPLQYVLDAFGDLTPGEWLLVEPLAESTLKPTPRQASGDHHGHGA